MADINGWGKLLAAILIPACITGIVAIVLMRAELTAVEKEISTKADQTVVEANQRAIVGRLDRLADQLERYIERSARGTTQ